MALSQRQSGVTERYQKLEELLLRLADMEVAENPERSALLRRAARQSRDKFVLDKIRTATESFRTEEFQQAVENQESAEQELGALLTLLMSEDRSKRIRDEKERYRKLIKDLKAISTISEVLELERRTMRILKMFKSEQKSVTKRSQGVERPIGGREESATRSTKAQRKRSKANQAKSSRQMRSSQKIQIRANRSRANQSRENRNRANHNAGRTKAG